MAETKQSADDNERRVAPRIRTLKRARVLFNNRFSTIDCIVRNVSSTGALLTIDPAVHLPRTFEIAVGEDPAIRPAKLVYRREMFAGVHFLDVELDETSESEAQVRPVPEAAAAPKGGQDRQAEETVQRIEAAPLPRAIRANFMWARR